MSPSQLFEQHKAEAENGNANAQAYLGYCYREGVGVVRDDVEAVKWFRKAAEQNNADAQYNLGVCYRDGQGVVKDEPEAVKWFRKAEPRLGSSPNSNVRFETFETFAKAERLARQQQAPSAISKTQTPSDVGPRKQSEPTPPSRMSPWKRAEKAFGFGFFVGAVSFYEGNRNNSDFSSSGQMLFAGILGVFCGLVTYFVAVVYYANKGKR